MLKVEGSAENEKHAGDTVGIVKLDPLVQLLPEPTGRDTLEPDTARLACLLQLLGAQTVCAFRVDHLERQLYLKGYVIIAAYHIVDTQSLQSAPDLVLQEVVCAKGVDVDVSAHRDELGSR